MQAKNISSNLQFVWLCCVKIDASTYKMVIYNHTRDVASSVDLYDLLTTEPPYDVPTCDNQVSASLRNIPLF